MHFSKRPPRRTKTRPNPNSRYLCSRPERTWATRSIGLFKEKLTECCHLWTRTTDERRALFVICTALVAMPIIAWGPLAGFLPSFANLLVVPSVPAYLEELSRKPKEPYDLLPRLTLREGIALGLFLVLAVVNFIAVVRVVALWMQSTR
jgi:hypothetical protein